MLNIEEKEDSIEKLAAVQGKPTKHYLFAPEFNQIVTRVNDINGIINPDRIISLGTETITGDEYSYEGYVWQLGGILINNTGNPSTFIIPAATTGFRRKDISVFNNEGNIIRIAGEETDGGVASTPAVPPGTLYLKSYDINGSTIEVDPEPPVIDGSIFKKKTESLGYGDPYLSGANAVIQLRPEGNSRYAFSNPGLISIDGFGTSLITGNPNAEAPYDGKDLFIENTGTTPITLLHDGPGTATTKFFFLEETDLIIPAGGKVWLKYGNPYCEVIFKSWGDISSTKEIRHSSPYWGVSATLNTWQSWGNQNSYLSSIPSGSFGTGVYPVGTSIAFIYLKDFKKLKKLIFSSGSTSSTTLQFLVEIATYNGNNLLPINRQYILNETFAHSANRTYENFTIVDHELDENSIMFFYFRQVSGATTLLNTAQLIFQFE